TFVPSIILSHGASTISSALIIGPVAMSGAVGAVTWRVASRLAADHDPSGAVLRSGGCGRGRSTARQAAKRRIDQSHGRTWCGRIRRCVENPQLDVSGEGPLAHTTC